MPVLKQQRETVQTAGSVCLTPCLSNSGSLKERKTKKWESEGEKVEGRVSQHQVNGLFSAVCVCVFNSRPAGPLSVKQ